jgi:molybdopterin synthase catalytic subunit
VRNHDPEAEGEVIRLEYSAHPSALSVLEEVVAEFSHPGDDDSPEVRIAVQHRIGSLDIGDAALIVCVSSAHRGDSFDLCKNLVEAIKARVPIWKKQFTSDDDGVWLGLS